MNSELGLNFKQLFVDELLLQRQDLVNCYQIGGTAVHKDLLTRRHTVSQ